MHILIYSIFYQQKNNAKKYKANWPLAYKKKAKMQVPKKVAESRGFFAVKCKESQLMAG